MTDNRTADEVWGTANIIGRERREAADNKARIAALKAERDLECNMKCELQSEVNTLHVERDRLRALVKQAGEALALVMQHGRVDDSEARMNTVGAALTAIAAETAGETDNG